MPQSPAEIGTGGRVIRNGEPKRLAIDQRGFLPAGCGRWLGLRLALDVAWHAADLEVWPAGAVRLQLIGAQPSGEPIWSRNLKM